MCLTAQRFSPNLISTSFVLNKTTPVAENGTPHNANLITSFLLFNAVMRLGIGEDNHLLLRLFCRENKVEMRLIASCVTNALKGRQSIAQCNLPVGRQVALRYC
jgi:hypothetical protein